MIGGHKKPQLSGEVADWLRDRCRLGRHITRGLTAELTPRGIKSAPPPHGELFTLYAEQVLAPTLAKGDIVVLNDRISHKGTATRRAIRQAGARVPFLPPYSPDLNPIEQLFAKLRDLMRNAEPRTVQAAWRKLAMCSNRLAGRTRK